MLSGRFRQVVERKEARMRSGRNVTTLDVLFDDLSYYEYYMLANSFQYDY